MLARMSFLTLREANTLLIRATNCVASSEWFSNLEKVVLHSHSLYPKGSPCSIRCYQSLRPNRYCALRIHTFQIFQELRTVDRGDFRTAGSHGGLRRAI